MLDRLSRLSEAKLILGGCGAALIVSIGLNQSYKNAWTITV
jgi:hypothetical protein